MPEYDEDGTEIEEPDSEGMRGLRQAKKAAEQRAQEAEERAAAGDAAMRKLASIDAGLDPNDKSVAFFLKHYDGDPTADAMKSAAIDAGVLPEVDAQAQASTQGQAQMSAAFSGGEHVPLGTTQVGDRNMRVSVPAEEAEMWGDFEQAVKRGDFQGGQEILRSHGREMSGIEDIEYEPGAGAPNTNPISGRPL